MLKIRVLYSLYYKYLLNFNWLGAHDKLPHIWGFSSQYFPNTTGTPFPLYFGVITNPDIKHISVLEKDRLMDNTKYM